MYPYLINLGSSDDDLSAIYIYIEMYRFSMVSREAMFFWPSILREYLSSLHDLHVNYIAQWQNTGRSKQLDQIPWIA